MPTVRLKPKARTDLDNIWQYSRDQWSENQADAYYLSILEALNAVLMGAASGAPVNVTAGYRKHLVGSHVIYYRSIPTGIEVVRVLHQSMDAKRHLT
jgi:toxin ParE1/3/4